MFLGWQANERLNGQEYVWLAGLSLVIHFISVLLHEVSHCHFTLNMGASVDHVVLVPWGGIGPVYIFQRPKSELLSAAAGPLANLLVCLASAAPLLFAIGTGGLLQLLHPLKPVGVAHGPFLILLLKLSFWINWLLFLVNLFPVFPLDGSRVLRSGLLFFWPEMTEVTATRHIARGAQSAAAGLFVVAWLVRDAGPAGPIPTWFVLVLLSIFLFFAAQREIERQVDDSDEDDFFGCDFSQGYTSLKDSQKQTLPSRANLFARWVERRQEQRQERKKVLEAEEEQRMDEILHRLNETGLKGLSREERHLLDRVSARYRSRMDH
ncbi:MAG: hypothetical protein CMJ81_20060 [Planctomycetaceae bacterium]|nr:hypothetical protein [Planctomycetaceae bacterium]